MGNEQTWETHQRRKGHYFRVRLDTPSLKHPTDPTPHRVNVFSTISTERSNTLLLGLKSFVVRLYRTLTVTSVIVKLLRVTRETSPATSHLDDDAPPPDTAEDTSWADTGAAPPYSAEDKLRADTADVKGKGA